jgi:hypothetical protein
MSPSSIRIVVVLPEPLGPRKPYTLPVGTTRSSPSTTAVCPRRFVSPFVSIANSLSIGPSPNTRAAGALAALGCATVAVSSLIVT